MVIYSLFGLVEAWDGHGKAPSQSDDTKWWYSSNPAITHPDKLRLPLIITSFTSLPHPESTQALTWERKRQGERERGNAVDQSSSSTQLTSHI